jgi:CRP/FNR family transcriptional regulator, cyclic AMP receptor protein
MTHAELLGYAAATCVFVTFYMKTMVPLRIAGIVSNFLFIGYGYAVGAYPVLILHLVLLPLNVVRLRQMLRLIRQIEDATKDDLNLNWVKPFSSTRTVAVGDVLFRSGDPANEMFFVVSGRFHVRERGVELEAGEVFGELGLLNAGQARTATVECTASGELLCISYDHVKQLYLQDPKFGFYFLHLVSKRLFHNLSQESRSSVSPLGAGQCGDFRSS